MHFLVTVGAAAALVNYVGANMIPIQARQTSFPSATAGINGTVTTAAAPTISPTGCAAIASRASSYLEANPEVTGIARIPYRASQALQCLKSVPLDAERSSAFLDYIEPYFQFQSTIAYLKDPPEGYLLPGVDLLGGLEEIKSNILNGSYTNQWDFEVDIYSLGNVLAHDFHMNLPLPLVSVFAFIPFEGKLVSISNDGLSLPQVYFKDDLDQILNETLSLNWTASPLLSVNGQDVSSYLQTIGQENSPYQDPDAIWNQLFYNLPQLAYSGSTGLFSQGAYTYGPEADFYNYTFANGTITQIPNVAFALGLDFTNILSGADLFSAVDLTPTSTETATETSSSPSSSSTSDAVVSSLLGYPTPVVIQSDGYTSGYFLENSSTAVLAIQGFIDLAESDLEAGNEQQDTIRQFLAECRNAGMTKLIIDLSTNGGGNVFNGYDLFKQLFPNLMPFGASRMRATPLANYLGAIFTADGVYNDVNSSVYQTQSVLDMNYRPFASWNMEDGPNEIYGDNFTAETRFNLSDPLLGESSGFNISGYLNESVVAPQLFGPDDIVMLMDGACGSTCATFAELMKSQGGVRTISVGGRPQLGPSQGVGGSKGAQVLTYQTIAEYLARVPDTLLSLRTKGFNLSNLPSLESIPDEYIPYSVDDLPLGPVEGFFSGSRFNLRNSMRDGDPTNTPLQFIYEASNCRLFYTLEDLYDMTNLWIRISDVAWGNASCVEGSTISTDNTISSGVFDTVPYSPSALSTVVQKYQPGLLGYSQVTIKGVSGPSNTTSTVPITYPRPTSGAGKLSQAVLATAVGTMVFLFSMVL